MGLGSTNKRKGSNAERYYAKIFRDLGFTFCETSRFVSKKHDNAKIDLVNIPFNIQIKAGIQKGLNPLKELRLLRGHVETMFPKEDPVHSKPDILIHYKQGTSGKKRSEFDEAVYIGANDLEKFCLMLNNQDSSLVVINTKMEKRRYNKNTSYVGKMSFYNFKKLIIEKLYETGN